MRATVKRGTEVFEIEDISEETVNGFLAQVATRCECQPTELRLLINGIVFDGSRPDARRITETGVLSRRDQRKGVVSAIALRTSPEDATRITDAEERYEVAARFRKESAIAVSKIQTAAKGKTENNRFGRLMVLESYADKEQALALLTRLSNDKGIREVMAKHDFSVGTLSEMEPEGLVGVDPVCVLGLNVNKGQEIRLRLRTDDGKGFRKYLSIKHVLCHELAHNIHSDHNSDFLELESLLKREAMRLDWANGRTLSGSR